MHRIHDFPINFLPETLKPEEKKINWKIVDSPQVL